MINLIIPLNEDIKGMSTSSLRSFELVKNVYWVGARDVGRRLFDSLIPLPLGTSYNSYLIVDESIALIDTVNPGFEDELIGRIRSVTDPSRIDYVIMNHAEPDHAGAIPAVLSIAPRAKLVTTSTGARMAKLFYKVPENRVQVVKDGDSITLGKRVLKFIEAPMLHWPETMFTYLLEDKILFTCDFFGAHVAQGLWSEDVDGIATHAQRYFGEIMMPFRANALSALKKISELEVNMIAPSHGPIYREPKEIIDRYWKWARGEVEKKVVIAYVSMWGYTRNIVKLFSDELASEGINVVLHDLVVADLGDLAKDLVDSSAVVIATPTVITQAHPLALQFAYLAKLLRAPTKYAVVIVLYAWGSNADKQLEEVLKDAKIELVGSIKINVVPDVQAANNLKVLAKELAKRVMSG